MFKHDSLKKQEDREEEEAEWLCPQEHGWSAADTEEYQVGPEDTPQPLTLGEDAREPSPWDRPYVLCREGS